MTRLSFEPQDTLFFRDGRPYNREEGQVDVVSQCPPSPSTVVGATRAAYARALGWLGGAWDDTTRAALGDGQDLGPLRFRGPWLAEDGNPLFAMPQALLWDEDRHRFIRLRPAAEPGYRCDLGDAVRLPVPDAQAPRAKPAAGYITVAGLRQFLNGDIPGPDEARGEAALFRWEPRTGHERERSSGTIRDDNALYSPWHLRFAPGVTLTAEVAGEPQAAPVSPIPLGGEGRRAYVNAADGSVDRPGHARLPEAAPVQYTAVLITPMDITETGAPEPGQPFAGLPGRLVSACHGRIQRIGGWDGVGQKPRPQRPHLPAGSVLFMECEDSAASLQPWHDTHIGAWQAWGFGHILIGNW